MNSSPRLPITNTSGNPNTDLIKEFFRQGYPIEHLFTTVGQFRGGLSGKTPAAPPKSKDIKKEMVMETINQLTLWDLLIAGKCLFDVAKLNQDLDNH